MQELSWELPFWKPIIYEMSYILKIYVIVYNLYNVQKNDFI